MKKYHCRFKTLKDVVREFDLRPSEIPSDESIIFACYDDESDDYCGTAYVLYKGPHLNQLYEVYGAHCSCDDMKGDWDPERTSWKVLKHKDFKVSYSDLINTKLKEVCLDYLKEHGDE